MSRFKFLFAAMLGGLMLAGSAFGQAGPGGGGGRGPGGGFQRNPFDTYIAALADANLSADFTLTADVKKQVQGVRDDFKKAQDDFRAANKDAIDKAIQAMRDAAGDRDAMQTARQSLQDLMAKGPKGEEYVAKVKALLTPDQAETVDKKAKEMQPPQRGGGGGGGGGGAPPAGN